MPRADTEPAPSVAKLRIDKWLWAARFYKTRSLAATAVEAGQVRVNGEPVKPSRAVHAGERINVRKAGFQWEVEVNGVNERRGSATDAARLYTESEASRQAREEELARRKAAAATDPRFDGRPTKRDRRKLEDFLNEP
ncbi:MAG: RNA-binding S4 domain-containing protein [Burkholderiaceae bacterium]